MLVYAFYAETQSGMAVWLTVQPRSRKGEGEKNLPRIFVSVFPALGEWKNIRFSEAAVSKKMGAADPISALCADGGMVDATGSNPVVREGVWVQVPLGAPPK